MFLGVSYLEWAANITTAICIFLAARNSVHTWWTGIGACILFAFFFRELKLYADVTLQLFFIGTGFIGWWNWTISRSFQQLKTGAKQVSLTNPLPITTASRQTMLKMTGAAVVVAITYGAILHSFTDASVPFLDAFVLTLSVIAQLLLMRRNIQTWPLWLAVNTLSVPMYLYKGAYVTAAMYSLFWVNAIYAWWHWRQLMDNKADLSASGLAQLRKEIWG